MIWCVKYSERNKFFDVEKLLSLADIKLSQTQAISKQGMGKSEIDGVVRCGGAKGSKRRRMILQYNKIHADEH